MNIKDYQSMTSSSKENVFNQICNLFQHSLQSTAIIKWMKNQCYNYSWSPDSWKWAYFATDLFLQDCFNWVLRITKSKKALDWHVFPKPNNSNHSNQEIIVSDFKFQYMRWILWLWKHSNQIIFNDLHVSNMLWEKIGANNKKQPDERRSRANKAEKLTSRQAIVNCWPRLRQLIRTLQLVLSEWALSMHLPP